MLEVRSPSAVREVMSRHGIACRKSLGQNFLMDPNIIQKIVDSAGLNPVDLVVEIGPGLGALTTQAARRAGKVLAVEVDRGLLPALAEVLEGAGNTEVVLGDALEIDFDRLAAEKTGGVFGRGRQPYKLLANLPYYITSPLLMHFLTGRFNISLMVVMLQLEVAARLTAAPGSKDYGALSVAVQYYTESRFLFRVPRTVFYPPPGVDSAVVRLEVRPEPAVQVPDEEAFFRLVRASFGRRRKTLLNSLAGSDLGLDKESWQRVIIRAGIDPGRRGETLNLTEFAGLTTSYLEVRGEK